MRIVNKIGGPAAVQQNISHISIQLSCWTNRGIRMGTGECMGCVSIPVFPVLFWFYFRSGSFLVRSNVTSLVFLVYFHLLLLTCFQAWQSLSPGVRSPAFEDSSSAMSSFVFAVFVRSVFGNLASAHLPCTENMFTKFAFSLTASQ